MRKGVAYLFRYREVSQQANCRYLEALAVVDDPTPALQQLDDVTTRKKTSSGRGVRAFNPLSREDIQLFKAMMAGEHQTLREIFSSESAFPGAAKCGARIHQLPVTDFGSFTISNGGVATLDGRSTQKPIFRLWAPELRTHRLYRSLTPNCQNCQYSKTPVRVS